jgi:hypothetical protein
MKWTEKALNTPCTQATSESLGYMKKYYPHLPAIII